MPASKPQFPDGAADIARRFGVSVKALRLYEELGILSPVRNGAGWRTYGQVECERIHLVLLLRQLGLPLSEIAQLLGDGTLDVGSVLRVQEAALARQLERAGEALAIVRLAQSRLSAGERMSTDELAELVRRTRSGRLEWTPELAALADRMFDDAQQRRLVEHRRSSRSIATDLAWAEIYEELAVLARTGDPRSGSSLSLAARAVALIHEMTGNDTKTWAALAAFWERGFQDPKIAASLPLPRGDWDFLSLAISAYLQTQEHDA